MRVLSESLSPPVGPSWAPTTSNKSHGIAPGATKAGSEEDWIAAAQMALVSRECCHVARGVPFSSGLGLRKWVMTCLSSSLNKVACGPKSVHVKVEPEGRQI